MMSQAVCQNVCQDSKVGIQTVCQTPFCMPSVCQKNRPINCWPPAISQSKGGWVGENDMCPRGAIAGDDAVLREWKAMPTGVAI